MTSGVPIARLAELADIPELVRLRGLMFSAMGIEPENQSWRLDAAEHYERGLSNGRIVGAVVDRPRVDSSTGDGAGDTGDLASGGVVSFLDQIPGPTQPASFVGHISSMCTEVEHRGTGMAAAVLDLLLAEIRRRGLTVAELHATPEGEALYRSRGFLPRPGGLEMQARL